ncbi:MAG TPA: phosphoribosylamine--glycine ligase [Bacteroidia bacterium]|nr:phosphoribosylamine--glycine ligase [Bacteroidia bacterium]
MNILLLGSGGREHALAWKISQSKHCDKLFVAPGNAGTARCGTNIPLSATDFEGVRKFVLENKIEMVVVGPEDPLVKGIHDFFLSDNELKKIPVIGPRKDGAQLEGSKDFSKQFMVRHNIPTARYQAFTKDNLQEGLKFLETLSPPYVLKADGLAAGKGVVIPQTLEEAKKELTEMLSGKFGNASAKVVIEEFLNGIELSFFVLTDGTHYKILPEAKDYKRIGENDTGLNTGGMGAVSPVPFADENFLSKVENKIIKPTIEGLIKEGIVYKGFIFVGLMKVADEPFVIEYNCRMGDPETEVVIPRIKNDLVEIFEAVAKAQLIQIKIEMDSRTAATVMLVSKGYPEKYEQGKLITGLEEINESIAFHAGTKLQDGKVLSAGGRVIAVTSFGNDISDALHKCYSSIGQINYENKYYRKDIGQDLLKISYPV